MIRVLIVDDEYIMRQGLKYMIDWEQEGFEIAGEATNGQEALGLIEKVKPHIIICDIVMPLMDGVDLTETVHHLYPGIHMIILSGYDNFEYVKRTLMSGAVDYILKPALNRENLLKILQKAAMKIPDYKLQDGAGSAGYERKMERYLLGHDQELDIPGSEGFFACSCFRIYAVNIKKENPAGLDLSEVLYQKIVREVEKISWVQSLVVTLREELACVIFGYEGADTARLLLAVEEMNGQLALLGAGILGVCTSPFRDLRTAREIYHQEVMGYVDKAFYWKGRNLLFLEKTEKKTQTESLRKFDFFRYSQLLSGREFTAAAKLLEQYNQDALKAQMDVYSLKNQIKNMLYHFLDFLPIPDEEKDENRFVFFKEIGQAEYEEDYRACMDRIMEKLLVLGGSSRFQNDDRMNQMLAYISRNYRQDLKLEDMAEAFSFNYHYLSAYFNRQMKEGFSDYLNRLRIEKACMLLKKGDRTISEISAEVGYSEHSYFCRVFKKITGSTPSEYRRSRHYE